MSAPTSEERAPARNRDRFDCPYCGTFAKQHWNELSRSSPGSSTRHVETHRSAGGQSYAVGAWASSRCEACNGYATWRDNDLIYPRSSVIVSPSPDMPEAVVGLYNEARDVMGVSRRAGAALTRATLELLVKDLYPDLTGTLADRLGEIIPSVSSSLGSMLTVIRHVGNKTLHVEEVPDDAVVLVLSPADEELVTLMFESINELVDEVITKPATAKKYLDLVPENVKKNVRGLQSN